MGLLAAIQKNIATDAWITCESWHYRLNEMTDLVLLKFNQKSPDEYSSEPFPASAYVEECL